MLSQLSEYLNKLHASHDEDAVDRINYLYTNFLLLSFAILLGAKQYVGEPLQCWVPAQFKGGWENYVETHCFIENTYFTKLEDQLPESSEERGRRELSYYQWMPVILALQAALCYAPRIIWKMLNKKSGMNLSLFIPKAMMTETKDNKKTLKPNSTDYSPLVEELEQHVELAKNNQVHFGKCVTVLYLTVKFLWLVNVVLQFAVLNAFLGPTYTFWGIGILSDLINGRSWKISGHFPRVTMCDVKVRELGNLHNWTVQCVLMVNMFAEKIFLFLWFWFCAVAIITVINFVYWVFITVVPSQSRKFIATCLEYKDITAVPNRELDEFIKERLRPDGITILRLMSENSGDLVVSNIVCKLWDMHTTSTASQKSGK